MTRTVPTMLLMAVLCTGAEAADRTETIDGWTVITRTGQAEGVTPMCILNSPTADGVRLQLVNSPRPGLADTELGSGRVALILPDPLIGEPKGTIAGALYNVPGLQKWGPLEAFWSRLENGGGYVAAFLEDSVLEVLRPMFLGERLEVRFPASDQSPGKSYGISLEGAAAAISVYQDCLSQIPKPTRDD
jgi:hypothetical protein